MTIEALHEKNLTAFTEMALALWPDCVFEEEYAFYKKLICAETALGLLAKEQEEYIAFIHLALRYEFVEGATSSPTAYVEGIYVKPAYRKAGVGRQLIAAGEAWARQKSCVELASDAELTNEESIRFHKQAGFSEINCIVCFVKKLS